MEREEQLYSQILGCLKTVGKMFSFLERDKNVKSGAEHL